MSDTKTKDNQQLALVTTKVVEGEIVTADAFNTQVATWRKQGYTVLTPTVHLSTIPKDHKIVANMVVINPDPNQGEVYQNPLFCDARKGEVALGKVALERIAQCASISIDASTRSDSGTVPNVWSYYIAGHWIGFDGNRIDRKANKTIDYRDGSADLKGFTPKQIEQARRHGEATCESKAINRLFRMYGLKQKYTMEELAKNPFIVLKLQWEPDMSNPIVAALVTQQRLGATSLMFPTAAPAGLPAGGIDPATVPTHQLPPEMRPPGEAKEEGDEDKGTIDFDDFEASEKDDATIIKVLGVRKVTDTDDYFIAIDGGRQLHTAQRDVAKACNEARKAGTALRVDVNGDELLEILGDQKSGTEKL